MRGFLRRVFLDPHTVDETLDLANPRGQTHSTEQTERLFWLSVVLNPFSVVPSPIWTIYT